MVLCGDVLFLIEESFYISPIKFTQKSAGMQTHMHTRTRARTHTYIHS